MGCRNFRLESTLEFIKINCKVTDIEEGYVLFRMDYDVWIIFFVYKKQKDTSNSTRDIVESKFCKWKEFRLVVLLVVIINIEVLF